MDEMDFKARLQRLIHIKSSIIRVSARYGKRYPVFKYVFFALSVFLIIGVNLHMSVIRGIYHLNLYHRDSDVDANSKKISVSARVEGFFREYVDFYKKYIRRGFSRVRGLVSSAGDGVKRLPERVLLLWSSVRRNEAFARAVAVALAVALIVVSVDGLSSSIAWSSEVAEVSQDVDDGAETTESQTEEDVQDTDSGESIDTTEDSDETDSAVSEDRSETETDGDVDEVDEETLSTSDEVSGSDDQTSEDTQDVSEDVSDGTESEDGEEAEDTEGEDGELSPVFSMTNIIDDVSVTVSADAGVFPEGCSLYVRKVVDEEEADDVDSAVEEKRDDDRTAVATYTYDIKVLDEEGAEIQPNTEAGTVKVYFALAEAGDTNLKADIYHISEDEDELVAQKLRTELETIGTDDVAVAQTTGFSYYTVEFTYGDLQYVLEGDSEVAISKVLEAVGLSGTVTDAESSAPELFEIDTQRWTVRALKAFDTEEWMSVVINGIEYDITVTDDQEEDLKDYNVLLWTSPNEEQYQMPRCAEVIEKLFNDLGVSVKRINNTVITEEDIENVQLVYIMVWLGTIDVDATAPILKKYVDMGGRVVINGENSNAAGKGNKCLSLLGNKLGADFRIDTGTASGNATINTSTSLAEGITGTLTAVAAANIITGETATWVAKTTYNGSDYVFIVDQPAGRGNLTAFSDINFVINDNYEVIEQGKTIIKNLLKDSVANIEKITANPRVDVHKLTSLDVNSSAYYRLLGTDEEYTTKTEIVTLKVDGNDVSGNNGWVDGEQGGTIEFSGLKADTPYILQTVSKDAGNGFDIDSVDEVINEEHVRTAIDPRDPFEITVVGDSDEEITETNQVFIYRNEYKNNKEKITISNIKDYETYAYALKKKGNNLATEYISPVKEDGKETGRVEFDGTNPLTTYYVVARRIDGKNDKSDSITIPYVSFNNQYIYEEDKEHTVDINDINVVVETKKLTRDTDYKFVSPDKQSERTDENSTEFERSLPDNIFSATEKDGYNFSIKYLGEYSDACYVTRRWKIQDLEQEDEEDPPSGGGGGGGTPSTPSTPGGGGGGTPPAPAPTAQPHRSTEVVLGESKFIRAIKAPLLTGYTDEQTGGDIEVKLTVTQETADDIEKNIHNQMTRQIDQAYKNVTFNGSVNIEYTDMTVTRKIGNAEPEIIPDVNRVLEIEVDCDLNNKFEPVVIREHQGSVAGFTKLDEKPEDNYKDGTYYVDADENIIWVYAQYFSKYSIAYLTKNQVVAVATPEPTKAPGKKSGTDDTKTEETTTDKSKKKTDKTSSSSSSKKAIAIRKRTVGYGVNGTSDSVPETGDPLPIVWLWALMLGTGIALLSYIVGSWRLNRKNR